MSIANPYDSFLAGQDPLPILAATPAKLASLAEAIGSGLITVSPVPGKWSPRDILCHLADCEIAFSFRLRQTLAEDAHIIQPFDQDHWARPYSALGATEALATFIALRTWNLRLFQASLPASAAKPVSHPERGSMTFLTIVETMAGHDLNHLAQLERLAVSRSA
ncbi:DinB family protein [Paracidobacterium acidisoli]|uniref:DinB family protein n=1 Tax=Paracidobacterium acidisoli TaxID=2303751 RepID=A0A372IPF7_9BACT|nr:DinB family protein [Paracidobacterium acidisoli]MBT9330906.1 DinB family protein [Paracidobacterium acidisoli]